MLKYPVVFSAVVLASAVVSGGCVPVPITDYQNHQVMAGNYDVAVGGAGQEVFGLTVNVGEMDVPSLLELAQHFVDEHGSVAPASSYTVDHAWVEGFSVVGDLRGFDFDDRLTVVVRGPSGVLAEKEVYPIPPLTAASITLVPASPLDLAAAGLSTLDVDFEVTGTNPLNSFAVTGSMLVRLEMHTGTIKSPYLWNH